MNQSSKQILLHKTIKHISQVQWWSGDGPGCFAVTEQTTKSSVYQSFVESNVRPAFPQPKLTTHMNLKKEK